MDITKCIELIREGIKNCGLHWDVDYRYYNNGLEAYIYFDTTFPNGKEFSLSVPYDEGNNPSHIGIILMESLHTDHYEEDDKPYIEDLSWAVNQSY